MHNYSTERFSLGRVDRYQTEPHVVRNLSQSNMYPGRHSCPGSVGGIGLCQGSTISKSRSSHSTVPGALPRLLRQRLRLSVAAHCLCVKKASGHLLDSSEMGRKPKRVMEHWLSVLGLGPACRRQPSRTS